MTAVGSAEGASGNASDGFGGRPLGTYAESSPSLILKDFLPGQGASGKSESKGETWDESAALIERYALQGQARKAMFEAFYRVPVEDRPKHPHRVVDCRRSLRPVPGEKGKLLKPAIFQHKDTGATFYAGHQICASGRACPCCAPKIGAIRADEIRKAVHQWVEGGGICLFVTLTFPHYAKDSLSVLVDSFKDSLARFRKGNLFDAIKEALGYEGIIRAVETTWGEQNGWHPHSHEIWFIRPEEELLGRLLASAEKSREYFIATGKKFTTGELVGLKVKLYDRWRSAVLASGLPAPSFEHGLDIAVAETEEECRSRLAEYLAKTGLELDEAAPVWGVDDELVKVHSKRGRPGRFTPFDFLRQQFNPENDKAANIRYRRLFAEFVEEFKGVAQVFWSRGLKAKFDLVEVSDDEAAEHGKEPASLLLEVLPVFWAFVIGVKDEEQKEKDYRAELLNHAREGGPDGAKAFLSSLLDLYYLDHYVDDFQRLSYYAQYLLALPDSAFMSIIDT